MLPLKSKRLKHYIIWLECKKDFKTTPHRPLVSIIGIEGNDKCSPDNITCASARFWSSKRERESLNCQSAVGNCESYQYNGLFQLLL